MRALLTAFVLLGAFVPSARAQDDIASVAASSYVHYTPIDIYRTPGDLQRFVYEQMALCSGLPLGDFAGIVWNTAAWLTDPHGIPVAAYWIPLTGGRRSIWIRRGMWNNPTILSHESLHDLSRGTFSADLANSCEIRDTGLHP